LGIIVACLINLRHLILLRKKSSIDSIKNLLTTRQMIALYFYTWLWSMIGSWLLGIVWGILINPYYRSNINELLRPGSVSLISFGGFIGGILAGFWYFKKNNLPALRNWDLVIVYLPLIRVIHRIGCFLNGCCKGKPTQMAIGVYYPCNNITSYHPFPLYMAGFLMLIFLVLRSMRKKDYPDGFLLYFAFMFYFVGRFFIEFFRSEDYFVRVISVTMTQISCIIGFVIFSILFLKIIKLYSKRKI